MGEVTMARTVTGAHQSAWRRACAPRGRHASRGVKDQNTAIGTPDAWWCSTRT